MIALLEHLNWRLQVFVAFECLSDFPPSKASARYSLSFITSDGFSRRLSLILILSLILQAWINEGSLYIWKCNESLWNFITCIHTQNNRAGQVLQEHPLHTSDQPWISAPCVLVIPEHKYSWQGWGGAEDHEHLFWINTHFTLPVRSLTSCVIYPSSFRIFEDKFRVLNFKN